MDGGAWKAAVHGVVKSQTRLSGFTFTFHFHALEKKMAAHSSFLAWRIPGTGEPGGLPSMGSQSRTQLKRLSSSRTFSNYELHGSSPVPEDESGLMQVNCVHIIPLTRDMFKHGHLISP